MPQTSQQSALSFAQIATGMGILAFWALFFTVGMAPAAPSRCYFAYEHAFPLADTILALGLIASGANMREKRTWGRGVALACAGALLFLGVIDLSFNIQNGGFSGPIAEGLQSGIISLWCVALGLWIIAIHGSTSRTATLVDRQR